MTPEQAKDKLLQRYPWLAELQDVPIHSRRASEISEKFRQALVRGGDWRGLDRTYDSFTDPKAAADYYFDQHGRKSETEKGGCR